MKTGRYFLVFVVTAVLAVVLPSRPSLAQEELACESDVIVQAGDWLSTIAEQAYGDPALYEAIVVATNLRAESDSSYATIDNPDLVEPGWKLCVPSLADAQARVDSGPATASPPGLTMEQLENATYSGIGLDGQPITLTGGEYESEPLAPDSDIRQRVVMVPYGVRYGDLNGDGAADAVVFLSENTGGTGDFIYIAAQLNQAGQPVDAGSVWIEDRIQIISVAIEDGQVMLEVTAEGPGDAACCKTYKTQKTYAVQDGQLTELSGGDETLVKLSATDLKGTSWTLVDLNLDQQPVLTDTEVTLTFADGQISGSGGCNNYTADFSTDEPAVLAIGPVVATRMACPEPILDQVTAYFSALENATQWGYLVGRLAIYYATDEPGYNALVFEPAAEPPAMDEGAGSMAGTEATAPEMLAASTWQWVRFTDPMQQFEVDQPENYTLTFQPDGTLQIKADCNQVMASYSASEDGGLSIQPGPATMAACPPGSRGEELVQNLGFAARYFFQDGNLFIDLMADGGTMLFAPVTG
jgi:heat shock protein HslJ